MKRLLFALLAFCSLISAKVRVTNETPWPIQFEVYWKGLTPANGFTNPWTEQYKFPETIQPGQSAEHAPEGGNIKRRYTVWVKGPKDSNFVKQYDQNADEGGDRSVTVYFKSDQSGKGKIEIKTGLL